MRSSTSFVTAAFAAIGAAAASDVPDLTDFSGDVGTFDVTATSGPASGISWANFSIVNTKLNAQADCNWQFNPDGPNPNITLGTQTQVVLFETKCNTADFAVYWGNASECEYHSLPLSMGRPPPSLQTNTIPAIQINYNTTLTSRPVTIVASDGLIPTQDCDASTCTASGSIGIDSVALLDNSNSDAAASQYGYWDVTYRNFTSKVQEGYKSEDFTFQYSGGGYTSCFKTTTEAGAEPNRFCTGDLEAQFDTAVVPERCKFPVFARVMWRVADWV